MIKYIHDIILCSSNVVLFDAAEVQNSTIHNPLRRNSWLFEQCTEGSSEGIGFDFVLKLENFNLPYQLISGLIQRFYYWRKYLKVHNRHVFFYENDVERIFGLKKGNTKIGTMLKKANVDQETKRGVGIGCFKILSLQCLN